MVSEPHLRSRPRLLSVVMPVRNAAATITSQLEALANQTFSGEWELVVADNGSTDATRAIVADWAARLPSLTVVDASMRAGPSFARNRAAEAARGDFLVFCDADDVVVPGWLEAMAGAATRHDVVTGPQKVDEINAPAVIAWRSPRATGLPRGRFLPFAPSCNLGVWAEVFRATGGFDEDYRASEDVEWSWRAQLASYTLGFEPEAVVHYRYRTSPRGVVRQAYRAGVASARLLRDYRRRGLQRRPGRRTLHDWAWLVVRLPYVVNRDRRGVWMRRAAEACGRISGSIRYRVLCL